MLIGHVVMGGPVTGGVGPGVSMVAAAWLLVALFACGGGVQCFMSFLAAPFVLLCQSLRALADRMQGGSWAVGFGATFPPPP